MKDLPNIQDMLADVIALIAFLQQMTVNLTISFDEQSKNGLFLFVSDILDRLKEVEKQIAEFKKGS
jgi:hypothetical protein